MHPALPRDEEAVVQRVRGLRPLIAAAADQIDTERRLPEHVSEAMIDAGVFRIGVPKAYGGLDLSPLGCGLVVEELAAVDGSTGWCGMIAWQNAALASGLPAAGARAIFGPRDVVCGVARQTGKAIPVEGGYRITGRWPFASGSMHATWFGGECMVMEDDEPERDAGGGTIGRICVLPRSEVTIHETWLTGGLRGTGSNDFSVENAFVPTERTFRILADPPVLPGRRYENACMEFIGHGTQALGVARGALEAARELAPKRVAYGGKFSADTARFQSDFARAQALIESGQAYLYGATGDLWSATQRGEPGTAEQRARVRAANNLALRNSVEAVDLLYAGLGTSSLFTNSPLERRFRDIHAAAAHIMIGIPVWEAAGRVFLGREAEFPFF